MTQRKTASGITRRKFLRRMLFGAVALAAPPLGGGLPQAGASRIRTDPEVVRIALSRGSGNITCIAHAHGELEKKLAQRGIKVEWIGPFPNHAPSLQAVVGGSADFSFGGSTTPGVAAILAGSPIVFTLFYDFVPRTSAIITKDPTIRSVPDLVGKKVAVNRSGIGEMLLVSALEKFNIERSKVNFIYLNPPDANLALGADEVDAWAMWPPAVEIARQRYNAHKIFEDKDLDFQTDFSSFLVRRDFAEKNPSLIRTVNEAFIEEGKWAGEHPEIIERQNQRIWKFDEELYRYFVSLRRQYPFWRVDDAAYLDRLQKAVEWLADHGVLPQKIAVRDYLASL
jgi:sulfonate transport system substrate-binding protein